MTASKNNRIKQHKAQILLLHNEGYTPVQIAAQIYGVSPKAITAFLTENNVLNGVEPTPATANVEQQQHVEKQPTQTTNTTKTTTTTVDILTLTRMNEFLEDQVRKLKRQLEDTEAENKVLRTTNLDLDLKVKHYDKEKELEIEKMRFNFERDAKPTGLNGLIDSVKDNPVMLQMLLGIAEKVLAKTATPAIPGMGSISPEVDKHVKDVAMLFSVYPHKSQKATAILTAYLNDANNTAFEQLAAQAAAFIAQVNNQQQQPTPQQIYGNEHITTADSNAA